MRPARPVSSLLATVAAVALLAACGQPDAAPAPIASTTVGATPGVAAAPPATAVSPDDGQACGGDACGSDACSGDACSGHADDDAAQAPALRRVASDQVCMRTNRFLGRTQRKAEVEGRTYFGCCAGCIRNLGQNAASRTAKDPVTGQDVDKASAVIAARPDGTVVYFASEETFTRAGGA